MAIDLAIKPVQSRGVRTLGAGAALEVLERGDLMDGSRHHLVYNFWRGGIHRALIHPPDLKKFHIPICPPWIWCHIMHDMTAYISVSVPNLVMFSVSISFTEMDNVS